MIAHISPASVAFEESRNTLTYADRAKSIRTRVCWRGALRGCAGSVITETNSAVLSTPGEEELGQRVVPHRSVHQHHLGPAL